MTTIFFKKEKRVGGPQQFYERVWVCGRGTGHARRNEPVEEDRGGRGVPGGRSLVPKTSQTTRGRPSPCEI